MSDLSFGRILLLVLLLAIGAGVVGSVPELRRYMKIRTM
jgi:hypothetical protein